MSLTARDLTPLSDAALAVDKHSDSRVSSAGRLLVSGADDLHSWLRQTRQPGGVQCLVEQAKQTSRRDPPKRHH